MASAGMPFYDPPKINIYARKRMNYNMSLHLPCADISCRIHINAGIIYVWKSKLKTDGKYVIINTVGSIYAADGAINEQFYQKLL